MTPASPPRRPALVALTRRGARHAAELLSQWPEAELYLLKPWAAELDLPAHHLEPPLRPHVAELLQRHDPVCFFSALGAVVRLIAPHLRSKHLDPAVLAIDEGARFVIPVVSGHVGGGNRHAQRIARLFSALPVVTTASDILGTLAVDLLGRELGWQLQASSQAITRTAACVVNDEAVAWVQECGSRRWRLHFPTLPANIIPLESIAQADPQQHRALLWVTWREDLEAVHRDWPERLLVYRPPKMVGEPLVLGIGCDRDTPFSTLVDALTEGMRIYPFSWEQIVALATIDRKGDEPGLLTLAERLDLSLTLFPATRLAQVQVPNPSATVLRHMQTPSVAEAAALLAGGALLWPKWCYRGLDGKHVTLAIARGNFQQPQERHLP
ncbi:MAG: cobalamin biosynthesis protein [Magnetococcus sp. XQGC-1]